MNRESPPPSRDEAHALMVSWAESLEGLEALRRVLPEGATLDDALRVHRRLGQLRRQPSRVMQEEDAP